MELTVKTNTILFCTTLLLVLVRSSESYSYSCDVNAACGCASGTTSTARIVGGEIAQSNTWTWAVSLSLGGSSLCGGAVLSSTWIITAAHCVKNLPASQVRVYAGSIVRFDGQSRTAASITVHPNYNSVTNVNDIALIRLRTPLSMGNSSVRPICIPSVDAATLAAGEWPPADLFVVAVGWGTLWEDGSLPLYLQQVTVQTMDYRLSTCSSQLNDVTKQLCAGAYGGGKDTCQGDSGGPLMMFTTSKQWVLIGLTSYGDGCARANAMGVYTRVAAYQDWIRQTTGSAITTPSASDSARINPFTASNDTTVTDTGVAMSSLPLLVCLLLFIAFCL